MKTVREIMTTDVQGSCFTDSVSDAARIMRDLGVGALPIRGEDGSLCGMITDRDIAVGCVAEGRDPEEMTVGQLARDQVWTVGADETVSSALRAMTLHGVRRLPVVDGMNLVGVLSQADIARKLPEEYVGALVAAISQPRGEPAASGGAQN
jgi:CBS domain-containing protein